MSRNYRKVWEEVIFFKKNLPIDSNTAFSFKYYLKRFCKTPMQVFLKFPDNFWSSILSNIELIHWLSTDLRIITGQLTMSGKKSIYTQGKLLRNGHSCQVWS